MPTREPQKNPHQAGDVVCLTVQSNASGEGVLWKVTKTSGPVVWIEPLLTITGDSKLRPKRVVYHDVHAVDFFVLGDVAAMLNAIILDVATRRGS